mgnify:CR=1 FL=1
MAQNNSPSEFMKQTDPKNFSTEASANLDAKNLDILKDEMLHEALAYKKCKIYSELLDEQPLKEIHMDCPECNWSNSPDVSDALICDTIFSMVVLRTSASNSITLESM